MVTGQYSAHPGLLARQWRVQGGQSGHAPQSGHGIHCGQLILRKISKIGATRCQILQRSPYPLAVFKGPTSKGRKGEGKGRARKGRES